MRTSPTAQQPETDQHAVQIVASSASQAGGSARRRLRGGLLALVVLAAVLAAPLSAWAATDDGSQVIGDTDGSAYAAAASITVNGTVNGDLYVAAQNVTVTGTVNGDILGAAQTITVNGSVLGNVRAAGQTVNLNGDIGRSITLAGETVVIGSTASVGDDATLAGSRVIIAGSVGRDALVGSDDVIVNGSIGRDFTYGSQHELTRGDNASIGGEVIHHQVDQPREPSTGERFVGWVLGLLFWIAAGLAIALLTTFVAPRWLSAASDVPLKRLGLAVLTGLVTVVSAPVAIVISAITIIGLPLAGVLLLTVLALHLLGLVVAAHLVGRLLLRRSNVYLQTLLGVPLLVVGITIPFLGLLVMIAAQLIGIGSIVQHFWQWRRSRREQVAPIGPSSPAGH